MNIDCNTYFNLSLDYQCKNNKYKALYDMQYNGIPKLLLFSGIASIVYDSDSIFESKYKIDYYDYGCIGESEDCMKDYNMEVFKYLDKEFGISWRKEIRPDVIGLKDYIEIR